MQRTFRIECCSFLKWTLMFQPVTKIKEIVKKNKFVILKMMKTKLNLTQKTFPQL